MLPLYGKEALLRTSTITAQMKRTAAAVAIVAAALVGPWNDVARAVEIEGTSSTYLQARETVGGADLLPVYEYLNFNVQDIGATGVSFSFGGWLRFDLGDHADDKKKNSDLQYAFLNYRHKGSNAAVNLGRVMVFEGVAAERVDGVHAWTDLLGGFGVSVYGGVPVMTNEEDETGTDSIYGARLSHAKDGLYHVGLSYLMQEKNSAEFREEEGVDLWFRPLSAIEVVGRSAYNALNEGWMQHTYALTLGPFARLRLTAEASRINYQYYFNATTNSAFTFTPGGAVDPKEKLDLLGLSASYAFGDALSLTVDAKEYGYAIAGSAHYYGAALRYQQPKGASLGASVHRMDGETDRLSYDQYRLYGSKRFGRFDAAVDLLDVEYDAPVNGVDSALTASIAGGYELTDNLRLGADVTYAETPGFDEEVRAFLKLIYRFRSSGKGKGV